MAQVSSMNAETTKAKQIRLNLFFCKWIQPGRLIWKWTVISQATVFSQVFATLSRATARLHLLAGRLQSWGGAILVPLVTISNSTKIILVYSPIPSRLLRLLCRFQRVGAMYLEGRDTVSERELHRWSVSHFLQAGDLQNVVSISNDKTALWAILACQSWHSFLSLPKTPSCNA